MLTLSLICFCLAISQSIAYQCPEKNGYFKDPENQHMYYDCTNGVAFHSTCPDNLVFDESIRYCNYAENVKTVSPHPTTSAPTHTVEVSTHGPEVTTHKQEVTTHGPEVTTHGPEVTTHGPEVTTHGPEVTTHGSSLDCKGKTGLWKDPINPHIFHECVNGKVEETTCPEHLIFNEAKQVCDFDTNAGTATPVVHHTDIGTQSTPNSHNTPTPVPTGPPQTEGTRQRHTPPPSF